MINDLGSITEIRNLVEEKTGSGEDVLYLIGKHNIIELLENPIMKCIIKRYWEGPYVTVSI